MCGRFRWALLATAGVPFILEAVASTEQVTAYRFRAEAEAGLNADSGWAAAENQPAGITVDRIFRLRVEVETPPGEETERRFSLEYRRNAEDWEAVEAHHFPYPSEDSPRVSIPRVEAYADGDPTADLLSGSALPALSGTAMNLRAPTPVFKQRGVSSEWEWPLVVRRFADGPVLNADGDRFAFRLVDASGEPLEMRVLPEILLEVPPRHLGGTFVETPGRIGPWQAANGHLYFIMEPTETDNRFLMMRSTDGGRTWFEADPANRPPNGDLESVASRLVGDTLHIIHQTSVAVWYYTFRTADHPDHPDSWGVRAELLSTPGEPPVQAATLAARPDGSLVAVHAGPSDLHYLIRDVEEEWAAERRIPAGEAAWLSGPQAVADPTGLVHLGYTDASGRLWYRQIGRDGSAGSPRRISEAIGREEDDIGSLLPLVYLPDTYTLVMVYRASDGYLYEQRLSEGLPIGDPVRVSDRTVVRNAVDSDQAGADLVRCDGSLHLLFIEEGSGILYHTRSDQPGLWSAPAPVVTGEQVQWVRGNCLHLPDGRKGYGFVYDGGSDGGSGFNRYSLVPPGD